MRQLLSGVVAAVWLFAGQAGAAPDRQEAVEAAKAAAADWLVLVDSRKFAEGYDEMSAFTRKTIGRDEWVKVMNRTYSRVGAIRTRDVILANYSTSFPKAPPGEYVVIRTKITSDKFPDSTVLELLSELIILVRDGEGTWNVYGYLVTGNSGGKPIHPG